MASKWAMPQLTLPRGTVALMLVLPTHLHLFLPQCTLMLCHLLVLHHPLLHLALRFVCLLSISMLVKMGSMTLWRDGAALCWC